MIIPTDKHLCQMPTKLSSVQYIRNESALV